MLQSLDLTGLLLYRVLNGGSDTMSAHLDADQLVAETADLGSPFLLFRGASADKATLLHAVFLLSLEVFYSELYCREFLSELLLLLLDFLVFFLRLRKSPNHNLIRVVPVLERDHNFLRFL